MNGADIVILVILVVAVFFAIRFMIKKEKNCGGCCNGCAMAGSCHLDKKHGNGVEKIIEVGVLNNIKEADVWIIPDTEKNRKTTLWGKANLEKLAVGSKQRTSILSNDSLNNESSNLYLFRMIDKDKMYYSADGVFILENQYVVISESSETMSYVLTIYDDMGKKVKEYSLFAGRL